MRIHLIILSSVFLGACEGDDQGNTDDTNTPPPPTEPADCDSPGNACRWLGIPGAAAFSGEGTDTSDDLTTGTFLFLPQDLWIAPDGSTYYPDFNNHRIRKVSTDGIVTTVSGTGMLGDGPNDAGSVINCWTGCDASLSAWNHPTHVIGHPDDSNLLYVSAWHNSRLNIIDQLAGTMTWYAGTGGRFYGSGIVPTTALLPPEEKQFKRDLAVMDLPAAIAFGADGTLYFADQANHLIRKIAPGSDKLEVFAGTILVDINPETGLPYGPQSIHRQPGFAGDGDLATLAKLHGHTDQKADPGSKIVYDEANNRLILADSVNGVIRAIDLDTNIIDTIAGKYTSAGEVTITDAINGETYTADAGSVAGYSGDGGPALEAVFNTPRDIALGIDGEIYIADTLNHCVRVLSADGSTVDTFAGTCGPVSGDVEVPWTGDGLLATEVALQNPFGVEVDAAGNVYIASSAQNIIVRVAH